MKIKTLLIALVSISTFISCSKNKEVEMLEGQKDPKISVNYTVEVSGTLSNNPKVEYSDATGKIQTETITGNWNKSFVVDAAKYDLVFKASGTVSSSGNVTVKVKAKKKGSLNEYSVTSQRNNNFNFNINKTIE
ncbi:hypothetical protein ACSIGC_11140 [Tenacibaculum sp. ZS6-P6]|uniref:hypothetical protein n=1 Tax=Tenacibaculum sp. ZS6-P6 TaxID=3447503 RepID=UPI003F965632